MCTTVLPAIKAQVQFLQNLHNPHPVQGSNFYSPSPPGAEAYKMKPVTDNTRNKHVLNNICLPFNSTIPPQPVTKLPTDTHLSTEVAS